jgi:UDPglucose 6-dehydrogenase
MSMAQGLYHHVENKKFMKIVIVGSGYVGLVTGACFAEVGIDVVCVDIDQRKIDGLNRGIVPIYEPGLEEMLLRNMERGRLQFTTQIATTLVQADVVFIAVGTPPDEDGSADLKHVLAVARDCGRLHTGLYTGGHQKYCAGRYGRKGAAGCAGTT